MTGDESWCFVYNSDTKRQSKQWIEQSSPRPKKLRFQKSRVKTMLILFFDHEGVDHKKFMPQGTTMTSTFYKSVLEWLFKRIARVRPEKFKDRDVFILQDNTPAHNAAMN